MNTNLLKRFAQEARKKLIQQVGAKLEWVLQADTPELREKTEQLNALRKAVQQTGKEQLIDTVAYTWFNRLVALRFMDVNAYQPLRVQVLSPVAAHGDAEILQMAKQGTFPAELKLNQQHLLDLLDGRVPSSNPQNEVYRALLIASCNYLHSIFPFLFERIDDYTELLLPDDLISELSIIQDFVNGMTEEDCQEVEIMGWLYQFYISERNDELISSKKAYKKDELAPASQLFTPKWIVQYMVDNTLGQVWAEMNPNTHVIKDLEFYITPDYKDVVNRPQKPIEEIKFFEPCVGSGHILAYAFDVYYKMYEEAGYSPSEIPFLILKHNLYGVDIDPRATQIASFTLLMKAREKNRRFFRRIEQEQFTPNILFYEDFDGDPKFNNATALGSLIRVTKEEAQSVVVESNTLFAESQQKLKELYLLLSAKYDVVVTNPPYISSSRMEPTLKEYVNSSFPNTKTDLFASFILRNLEFTNKEGLTGYMTPFVWMFISSYEKLRKEIIEKHFINNLIQLEYSGFDGATVPICTFTLRNKPMDAKGSYIRLSDFRGSQNQAPKTLEAIHNPDCGWFYIKNQKDFEKIPGNNIGYWLSGKALKTFSVGKNIRKVAPPKQGLATGNNDFFLRNWNEIKKSDFSFKWIPINKGGAFRKWFGNNQFVVFWENNGELLKNYRDGKGKLRSRPQNQGYYFKEGFSWSTISSSKVSFRYSTKDFLFETKGSTLFPNEDLGFYSICGFLNSKVVNKLLLVLSPTLDFHEGPIGSLPYIDNLEAEIIVLKNISISRQEWNSRETSWDFEENELIRLNGQDIEEAINLYKAYWTKKFIELHQNEEELNRQFIEIYGLEEDLDPNVPLEDITILRDELNQRELKELSAAYQSGWTLNNGKWELPQQAMYPDLPFDSKELVIQFISYAVGLMMGRYSLDKQGLILANQGEALSDFIEKVDKPKEALSFVPDADNIIPVLDSEWFEDDIVGQFKAIVKAVWGEANYQRNIRFIEDVLQSDIRKYISKEFYKDHIKRYKKRPIYWMFSSPKGAFNVLIYMHRYTADTISNILNNYLREFIGKLQLHLEHVDREKNMGTAQEQARVLQEIDKIEKDLLDCQQYEREILFDLATERIHIDLDDGVLVNYNKMGKAVAPVAGLNDAASKKKVREFDWIDTNEIRG